MGISKTDEVGIVEYGSEGIKSAPVFAVNESRREVMSWESIDIENVKRRRTE